MDELAQVLERGGGVVTVRTLPRAVLYRLVHQGRLVPLLPGVFTAPELATSESVRIRAVLTRHPDAILIGSAAARLSYWPGAPTGPLEFAGPRTTAAPAGMRFTRTLYHDDDVMTIGRLRLTTPARTALDLAVETGARSIDEILRTRSGTLAQLWQVWAASPHRPGNGAVRDLLADSRDEPWSVSERLAHRLLRGAGIVGWKTNHHVPVDGEDYFIDIAFEEVKLMVEIDGVHHRDDENTFLSDRVRQNALTGIGWTPLRYTGGQLETDPGRFLAQVRGATRRLRRRAA